MRAHLTAYLAFVGDDIDGFVLHTGRRVFFARDSGAQARAQTPRRQTCRARKRRAGQKPIDCTRSEVPTRREKAPKTACKVGRIRTLETNLTAFLALMGDNRPKSASTPSGASVVSASRGNDAGHPTVAANRAAPKRRATRCPIDCTNLRRQHKQKGLQKQLQSGQHPHL